MAYQGPSLKQPGNGYQHQGGSSYQNGSQLIPKDSQQSQNVKPESSQPPKNIYTKVSEKESKHERSQSYIDRDKKDANPNGLSGNGYGKDSKLTTS